jgi:CheY-like chemotaxis protein
LADRFSLLVVEDDPDKRRSIISALHGRVGNDIVLEIQEVADYQSARDALKRGGFDFVIMDLRIPAGRGEPSERWSRVLMQDIVNGELCYPMHIFGLTQYKDLEANERELYNQHLFGFYLFDRNDDAWANQIANKITYIASALQNGAAFRLNSFDYDLLILTARHDNEFIPIKEALFGQKRRRARPPALEETGGVLWSLADLGGRCL